MTEKICRLCLQTISNNGCQAVDESLLKSLTLNLEISKENVMCTECANSLQVFSNFTPGKTLPLSDLENGVKLDPEPTETTSNSKSLTDTKIKCSFCTKTRERKDLISLQITKERKVLVNMLEQYISETFQNLKNAEEFLTCDTCREALEGVFSVILKCLEVEDKISKYIELEGTDDKGQVELKKVQQFTLRPTLKLESESFSINDLEGRCDQIQNCTAMVEMDIKDEKLISNTELVIKTEDDDIMSEQSDCDIANVKSEQSDCEGFQNTATLSQSENTELCKGHELTKAFASKIALRYHMLVQPDVSERTLYCVKCSYVTNCRQNLKTHVLAKHNPVEGKVHECTRCSFKTKHSSSLQRHYKTIHRVRRRGYNCRNCSFQTNNKNIFIQHGATHKKDLVVYKCETCTYKTKNKSYLNGHTSRQHGTFKCERCSFKTNHDQLLNAHLQRHLDIKIYQCEKCCFQTIRYHNFFLHNLKEHRDDS